MSIFTKWKPSLPGPNHLSTLPTGLYQLDVDATETLFAYRLLRSEKRRPGEICDPPQRGTPYYRCQRQVSALKPIDEFLKIERVIVFLAPEATRYSAAGGKLEVNGFHQISTTRNHRYLVESSHLAGDQLIYEIEYERGDGFFEQKRLFWNPENPDELTRILSVAVTNTRTEREEYLVKLKYRRL